MTRCGRPSGGSDLNDELQLDLSTEALSTLLLALPQISPKGRLSPRNSPIALSTIEHT
jgi:hypothetical protein